MDEKQKYLLATAVIRRGKDLVPDRFPQPNPETIKAWAVALGQLMETLPNVELWEEAITVWSMEMVGERMATPREFKQAVYVVRDRWEVDPVRRPQLKAHWARQEALRDQQLKDGTFAALRGIQTRSIAPPAKPVKLGDFKEMALQKIREAKSSND